MIALVNSLWMDALCVDVVQRRLVGFTTTTITVMIDQ